MRSIGLLGVCWQSRKLIHATTSPDLHAQALITGAMGIQPRPTMMGLAIHNAGGGIAKGVGFVLVADAHYAASFVGDGFLRPGQTANIGTQMPGSEDTVGVVFCRDQDEESYAWNLKGEKQRLKRSKAKQFHTGNEILAAFYPHIDLKALQQVPALQAPSGF